MDEQRPRSEKEKMLAGEFYNALDAQLSAERQSARLILHQLNASRDDEPELRRRLLADLFGQPDSDVWLEPPFFCDYGRNIRLGRGVFFNFNCVVLDVAPVVIGDGVLCGPAVQIYTATHPLAWQARAQGLEYAKPVTIGAHVWVGGGAIICPGVTIGARSVIGAGSVVTRNVPPDVLAVGNPCRVIRRL